MKILTSHEGLLLDVSEENPCATIRLDLPKENIFFIDLDIKTGWFKNPLFYCVLALRKIRADGKRGSMHCALNVKGNTKKNILLLGGENQTRDRGGLLLDFATYKTRLTFYRSSNRVELEMYNDGMFVTALAGVMAVPLGDEILLDLSIPKPADKTYFPPEGWQYSNLRLAIVERGPVRNVQEPTEEELGIADGAEITEEEVARAHGEPTEEQKDQMENDFEQKVMNAPFGDTCKLLLFAFIHSYQMIKEIHKIVKELET